MGDGPEKPSGGTPGLAEEPGQPLAPLGAATPSKSITWRSALLGTLSVCLVCGLVPYNDFVVANTPLVGFYLPIVVVASFFVLIVLVNGPLHRFAPAHALRSGELAVVLAMMLVSCSIPTSGFLRNLLPTLVSPFHYGASEERFWAAFVNLHLPQWLFPVGNIADGPNSSIVKDFYGRVQPGMPIPYGAWIVPICGWGIFFFAMFAVLVAISSLVLRQWAANERLPFPLGQLQLALVEAPAPGRALNRLLGSRSFWVALVGVMTIESIIALHQYFPKYVPDIPMGYNLKSIMTAEPWCYLIGFVQQTQFSFIFIGVTYFLRSRVAFGLWAIFLVQQAFGAAQGTRGYQISTSVWYDQHVGACVAFLIGLAWIGRHHIRLVLSQTFRGRSVQDTGGSFGSYRAAMLVMVAGLIVMTLWLVLLGAHLWVAGLIIAIAVLGQVVTARIIAETGMPAFGTIVYPAQIYTTLPAAWYSPQDIFHLSVATITGPSHTREGLLPYALHGMYVNDREGMPRGQRIGLLGLIAWALVLGTVVAAYSSLRCYYTYVTPLSIKADRVLNPYMLEDVPKQHLVEPLTRFSQPKAEFPPKLHRPWLNMGIGMGLTAVLQLATWRWAWWPFAPVSYLLTTTWWIYTTWFSIFIGWLAKVLIIKYGGPRMFQRSLPFFVGLIFGEALAAALWLIISLILASAGYDYRMIQFIPL